MGTAARPRSVALLAILLLAGCASSNTYPVSPSAPLPPLSSRTSAAIGATRTLFVADIIANAVFAFNASDIAAGPIRKITSGINHPGSMAVAPNGDLYVTNSNVPDIAVYHADTVTPFRTIKPALGDAGLIAIGTDNTLAIAYFNGSNNTGTLVIYDRGSPTPTRTIGIPLGNNLLLILRGLAFDYAGNLYLSVSRYPNGPAQVLKFAPNSTSGIVTKLIAGDGFGIDSAGNVYEGETFNIFVQRLGASTPWRDITQGTHSVGLFAVASDGTLFVPNTDSYAYGDGNLVEYAPGGSSPVARYKSPLMIYPVSAALSP